ncbi:hypothetical protein K2Y11_22475 [bacterium]|nr:hypothetical protein [bacterium]
MSIAERTSIDPSLIPAELRRLHRWVVWRYATRNGKSTKIPCCASNPKKPASTTDHDTWASFEEAYATYLVHDDVEGIGFVFAAFDGLVGIDLDNCRDPETGEIKPWAQRIITTLASYAEISPSLTGVKGFARGNLQPGVRHRMVLGTDGRPAPKGSSGDGEIEVYNNARFFTITSQRLDEASASIEDRQEELDAILLATGLTPDPKQAKPSTAGLSSSDAPAAIIDASKTITAVSNMSDGEVLAKAFAAKGGNKFKKLYEGNPDPADYPSDTGGVDPSRADYACIKTLAFYFHGDIERIKRVAMKSGLRREKWDRQDYIDRTIQRAIEDLNGRFYDPFLNERRDEKQCEVNEAVDDPHRLARVFLAATAIDGQNVFVFHEGDVFQYADGRYRRLSPEEFKAKVINSTKDEFDRVNKAELTKYNAETDARRKGPPTAKRVTNQLTASIVSAVQSQIITPDGAELPLWLGDDEPPFLISECMVMPNAIIHIPSYLEGKRSYSFPPSPKLFTNSCLGVQFDPNATEPTEWKSFLKAILEDDVEAKRLLQQWLGYVVAGDCSQQKMLVITGPKRAGKGLIGRIAEALVGAGNHSNPSIAQFGYRFGLGSLVGKMLAVISDARIDSRTDTAALVEALLRLVSNEPMDIERKYLETISERLRTRLMILANETLRIPDPSGAIAGRMLTITLRKSWFGIEDTELESKLLRELPGILLWALEGLRDLRSTGRFIQPESGREEIETMELASSPVKQFVEEMCEVAPDKRIETQELYSRYKTWCCRSEIKPKDSANFSIELRSAFPQISKAKQERIGSGNKVRRFYGIDLMRKLPSSTAMRGFPESRDHDEGEEGSVNEEHRSDE